MPIVRNYPFHSRFRFVEDDGSLSANAVRILRQNVPNHADRVIPVGTIDGMNKVFTLKDGGGNPISPFPVESFKLWKRAAAAPSWTLMAETTGYSLAGATITYVTAPNVGDLHECDFRFLSPPE